MGRFLDELAVRHPRITVRRLERDAPQGATADHGEVRDPAQDSACYVCGCGFVFDAAVSTSVRCPHCGSDQAW